jgi:hypothetical protein
MSYSLLLLELGVSFQPLQSLYQQFSFLATHTWMKMLWEKLDKFNITVQTAESPLNFPRQGDKFLMLVFMERGHGREALIRLNQVRVHLQLIFLSNILSALGLRIDPMVLQRQATGKFDSSMRWPKEEPKDLDFLLWREAVEDICPSWLQVHSVGKYVEEMHQIHPWRWSQEFNTLLHTAQGSNTMDIYSNTIRKLNRYTKTASWPRQEMGKICSIEEIQPRMFRVTSTACRAPTATPPTSFLDVLREWGCTWLWEHMLIEGGTEWVANAIQDRLLVAVTDGSYIRQLYPHLCSVAFVLECANGCGRNIGSFSESSATANTYRGELLGLMAIHLLLVSINRVHTMLVGSVEVVLDCLGTLKHVVHLPPYRIPSRCKHLDILKNILINCRELTFTLHYSHVKAHQDDNVAFDKLSRKLQLNCICDHLAKQRISNSAQLQQLGNYLFPLKEIGAFIKARSSLWMQVSKYASMHTISPQGSSSCRRKSCPARASTRWDGTLFMVHSTQSRGYSKSGP